MKTMKYALVLIIIFLAIIISSCSKENETPTTVEVDLSKESKEIEAFGIVKAEDYKDIIIDFPAVVSEILVKEGQHVGLHEPILTLDLSQYQSQIQNEKIELSIAMLEQQNAIKNLEGLSLDDKELEINKLKNGLELLNNQYAQSVEDFNSKEMLFQEGAISQETYNLSKQFMDETKNKAKGAEYELQMVVESYEKNIEQFQTTKETEKNHTDILSERIKQIENNVTSLKNKLIKSYINANQIVSEYENAVIYDIKYSQGNTTDASQKAFTIANIDSLIIEANIPEEFIKDVKVDQTVKIVPVAERTKEYNGRVINMSQMAFTNNGETVIPIRISIKDIDSFLLPNFNVDVYIDVQ